MSQTMIFNQYICVKTLQLENMSERFRRPVLGGFPAV